MILYHTAGVTPLSDNKNYSKFQQNVIKRYYDNIDSIGLQRAQELITELYLAEGKKRQKVWDSLCKSLAKAGVPAKTIDHLRESDDPEQVAKLISQKI